MKKRIQKLLPLFSILLILVVLASLFLLPSATRLLSLAAIFLGLGMSIFLAVQRHRQAQQSGKITPAFMRYAIALDVTGLLVTMGIVMFVAGKSGRMPRRPQGLPGALPRV